MRKLLVVAFILLLAPVVASAQQVVTLHNSASSTGNGTTLVLGGTNAMVALQIKPTGGSTTSYTLVFEGSLDNSTWSLVTCYPQGSDTGATTNSTPSSLSTDINDRALYRCNVYGYRYFRARLSALSGSGLTVKALTISQPFSQGVLKP